MKRISAILTALLLITVTGCNHSEISTGDISTPPISEEKNSRSLADALNISLDHSYRSEKLAVDNMRSIYSIDEFDGKLFIHGYDGQEQFYVYHIDDGSVTPVELSYLNAQDAETVYCYVSANFINSENQPVFLYRSSYYDDENFQVSGWNTMEIYDTDFHLLETIDLKDVFPEEMIITNMLSKDGNYYIELLDMTNTTNSRTIAVYDEELHQIAEVSGNVQSVRNMFLNSEGKIILEYQDSNYNLCLGFLNTETNSVEKIQIDGLPYYVNASCLGKYGYDWFGTFGNTAYGVKFDEGICEEVINWVNSDFVGNMINKMIQLEDGRFIVSEEDISQSGSTSELWFLHERAPEELEHIQLITLATLWESSALTKAVNQFNRANTDYRIGMVRYSDYNTDEDYEIGRKKFENDMTSGLVADIICMTDMPFESYVNKGLLLDLTDYVNQLNPDEYFMNFFDSLKYNDKLYRIGFSYYIYTLEAKSDYVGEKSGLSLTEFTDLINQIPEDMNSFSEMDKNRALSQIGADLLSSFIDLNAGTCNFTSPEFIQLLEFCNAFPDDASPNTSNWKNEDWTAYWDERFHEYIDDETLFRIVQMFDVKQYLDDRASYFDTADVTFVGYPTNSGNGGKFSPEYTLAVSANSMMKDQVWEFFELMLGEEAQENLSDTLPVHKETFDKSAHRALEAELPHIVRRNSTEVEVPLPTQADIDKIRSYAEQIKESMYYNQQVYNIVYEEAQAYFAGESTPQDAAEMIQSRVSLYLAEQIQ